MRATSALAHARYLKAQRVIKLEGPCKLLTVTSPAAPLILFTMLKYVIILSVIAIAVILYFVYSSKPHYHSRIDSYKNVKESLKQVPNAAEVPTANIEDLDMEVNNGGFNQYFFNSSGQHCFETLRELKKLGMNKKARLLEEAIALINSNKLPEVALVERLRLRQVSELDDERISAKLNLLDQQFYALTE